VDIDTEVYAAAQQLFQQYGEDAEVIATMRAAEFAAQQDIDALHYWDQIIALLAQFTKAEGTVPDSYVN
jgi:hypothetical protein